MATGDLTTLANVQAWLDVSGDANVLQELIASISAFVPNVLNRGILSSDYVEDYHGNGKERMLLRQRPATAITSVSFCGQITTARGDPVTQMPGIYTDGRSLILVGQRMPYGAIIRVAYTAGYATVPADIEHAVMELVGEAYTNRKHIGETSHSSNGATTVAFSQKAMHDAITAKLSNYMMVVPC